MTSKITPEARDRCAAHTMADQLEQMKSIHAVELALLKRKQGNQIEEFSDVAMALEADMAWSGQHARLTLPIEGAD